MLAVLVTSGFKKIRAKCSVGFQSAHSENFRTIDELQVGAASALTQISFERLDEALSSLIQHTTKFLDPKCSLSKTKACTDMKKLLSDVQQATATASSLGVNYVRGDNYCQDTPTTCNLQ